MSQETEWFMGAEAKEERDRLRRRLLVWIGVVCAVSLLLVALLGCAAPKEEIVAQVCYMRQIAKTDEGYAVVLQACQSKEAFAESQK